MRSKTIGMLGAALGVAAMLFYVGTVTWAKWELGGSNPDRQTLGGTVDISQRAMTQFCTGVVVTPESTWLVGRREGQVEDFPFLQAVPDASASMSIPKAEPASGLSRAFGLRRDAEVTIISRLGPKGVFEPVAWLPDSACLHPTPDGKRIFLLTGISRPPTDRATAADRPATAAAAAAGASTLPGLNQFAIFQSDDQGRTWQWREAGLFPDAGLIAWSLNPYFYDTLSVWAWRAVDKEDDPMSAARPGSGSAIRSGLQHSSDGGTLVEDVMTSESLLLSEDEARMRLKPGTRWADTNGGFGELKRHVVQFDADNGAVWVSQVFRYALESSPTLLSHHLNVTSQALLHREGGRWRMGEIKRQEGLAIERLFDNRAGRVVALGSTGDSADLKLLLLAKEGLRWEAQGDLPGAFGSLTSWTGLREAFVGQGVVVVNTMSEHRVPGWMAPLDKERPSISADAVFYSTDWGVSWKRLAIDGYLGLLGLDATRNRVFWGRGNWYSSHDLNVYSDGLSPK